MKTKPPINPILADIIAASPYVTPTATVEENTRKRRATHRGSAPNPPAEPDLAVREEVPILGDSQKYAAEFWDRMVQKEPPPVDPPKLPTAPRRGRRPKGKSLTEKHTARFRVIDGDDKGKK